MKVAITAQIKNGLLYEAVKKCGSQSALAEYLGVSNTSVGKWLNFQSVPNFTSPYTNKKHKQLDELLITLIGVGLEEVFPEEVRVNKAALKRTAKIEAIKELPLERLIAVGAMPQLPVSPFEDIAKSELSAQIAECLQSLTPREEKIIKMRFGLDSQPEMTIEEIGQTFGVTRERIRQIEAKALRKLRHPSQTRKLKWALPNDLPDSPFKI